MTTALAARANAPAVDTIVDWPLWAVEPDAARDRRAQWQRPDGLLRRRERSRAGAASERGRARVGRQLDPSRGARDVRLEGDLDPRRPAGRARQRRGGRERLLAGRAHDVA